MKLFSHNGLMDWEIKFYNRAFIFSIIFVILAIGSFIYMVSNPRPEPKNKNLSGTFYMKYGGAVCGEYYVTNCGMHLLKCNGKEYHCMLDVSYDPDMKEEK